jgi:signal transduction histidine kinase
MYVLLAGFIQRASDTIDRQQHALHEQVTQLSELLAQNGVLHERVRRAAARATALNERFLRRISAELHDGPVQDLGLALLRLDHISPRCDVRPSAGRQPAEDTLGVVQNSLQRALQEVRAISAGLGLSQLSSLSLAETVTRVVRTHERRTGTKVTIALAGLPDQAALPIKITLYRVVQEALSNAYRHAGGIAQQVRVCSTADTLHIEIVDGGPDFVDGTSSNGVDHLGLIGMRDRVESLGGQFQVKSTVGRGTTVVADLALHLAEDEDG